MYILKYFTNLLAYIFAYLLENKISPLKAVTAYIGYYNEPIVNLCNLAASFIYFVSY